MTQPKIGIVISRFNEMITHTLLDETVSQLHAKEVPEDSIDVVWVPGAFEIPLITQTMAKSGKYDAIICLGAVIRGETPHFDYICEQVAQGIREISMKYELPVIFGVLTTNTTEQAIARARKGSEMADSALEMIGLLNK